jgi:signal transduction histidine kinase
VELQARADELQRSSKYKSEFLANMSHELRTPLNSSLILAKLLAENAEGNLSAEQVKFAESIYSAGNDLLNLINDILDIAKVEAGKLEVRPKHQVERLVEGLRGMFEPLAGTRAWPSRSARTACPPRCSPTASAWSRSSRTCCPTPSSSPSVARSACIGYQAGTGIVFAVRDTGIGIAADQQQASSKPSARPMAPPTAATAAPAWACRSRATWRIARRQISVDSSPGRAACSP